MLNIKRKQFLFSSILLLVGSGLSLIIAFWNGFPIIYSDTGAYIDMGFRNVLQWDRPIFYGLFIRHISLATSPWLVIYAQSFIVNWSIFEFLKIFFNQRKTILAYSASILFISVTTAFSYTTSVILPDIFTSICFLGILLYLAKPNVSKTWKALLTLIIAFSICSHLSHIPIFGILLTLTFIINIIFQKKSQLFEFKRFYELFIILIISVLLIPSVNYLVDGKFRLDNSHNAFAVNHLSEMGILKDFLNEECIQGNEYLMCQYIDDIGTCHLLWDAESPMKKTGGITANAADFDRIMKEVYTNPIFLKRILWASIPNGIQQFRNFRPTVMVAQLEGSAPYGQFQWRFKESLHDYLSSRQNQNTLNTSIVAYIQPYIVYSSLLFLLWVLTTVKNWKTKKAQLIRSCTI